MRLSKQLLSYLSNLILLIFSLSVSWIACNVFLWKYDWIDPRGGLLVLSDEFKTHQNTIPRLMPYSFFSNDIDEKINAYIDKGYLKRNFTILPDSMLIPLGSSPKSRMVYCQEDEGWYIAELDRYGFSNVEGNWDEEIDILLLGDSFAQGACTNSNTQYFLNNREFNTISLGMGGNGPLTSFAVYKEFLELYSANHVFWLIVQNDIVRVPNENLPIDFELEYENEALIMYLKRNNFTQNYFSSSQQILAFSRNVSTFVEAYLNANQNNILSNKQALNKKNRLMYDILSGKPIGNRLSKLRSLNSSIEKSRNEVFSRENRELDVYLKNKVLEIYHQSYEITKDKGKDITFVFLHSKASCVRDFMHDDFQFIKNYFITHGIDYLDFYPADGYPSCLGYFARKRGGHFNSKGYESLSKLLLDHIEVSQ